MDQLVYALGAVGLVSSSPLAGTGVHLDSQSANAVG